MWRRVTVCVVAAAGVAAPAVIAQVDDPERIPLPDGWQPEGIASGPGKNVWVGSIPTGQVLRLNTATGRTKTVVPERPGRAAIGLKQAGGKLFVAGGETGRVFVYDAKSGRSLLAKRFGRKGKTFVNDVTIAGKRAWFTDSQAAVLYWVDRSGKRTGQLELDGVPAGSDFNLNGIAAAGSKHLLAVHSGEGALYHIDPATGEGETVDLGGAKLTNGDGLLLEGRTLHVVQNRSNLISSFRLSADYTSGEKLGELESDEFDVPTTIARQNGDLYAVNARFGNKSPEDAEYWVTRVPEDSGD